MVDKQALDKYAANNYCKYCGHTGLRIEWRFKARPIGDFSLAGVQMKFSAYETPWMICDGCKHESEGK